MRSGSLCVSLTPETLDDVFSSDITGADCVEVRLDYLKTPQESTNTRWDRFPVPVIATCRGKERGGLFAGSIEEELRILESAARNGARFVDMDYRLARPLAPAAVIASYHNFDQTPGDLTSIMERILDSAAPVAKIATQVNTWEDNRRLFALLSRPEHKPLIVVGMGEMGQITRIAGPSRGSFLTYAASTRQAAPGQLSVSEMLEVYKFRRIERSTRLLGILGMPVGHSLSPKLHNEAFKATNLGFAYLKLPAADIKDFVDNADALGLEGFSVTIPHKVAIMPHLNRLTEAATRIGALNTVSRCEGKWLGDNTDVHGVTEALKSAGFNPAGKRVVIMGKGGGSKAAVAALAEAKEIRVLSRGEIEHAGRTDCDLLINATPLGMYPNVDASPVEGPISASVVFDMVYNPAQTRLLRSARAQGKTTISGTAMFLAQAARQFEIWTGQTAPREIYQAEFIT